MKNSREKSACVWKITEACLESHIENLELIGMKVNESKTEIILFDKEQQSAVLNVRGGL